MLMDILKELKDLILQNGLNNWIERFRHPENESFYDILPYGIKYDSKTDSRIYQYEEDHPNYNPFTDGESIVSIDIAFNRYLEGRLTWFEKEKENLLLLVLDDLPLLKEIASLAPDFSLLRKKAKQHSAIPFLTDLLVIHIGKMELAYNDFFERARRNNTTGSASPQTKKAISFGYKRTDDLLPFIYNELILEKGDFIDKVETSLDVFINILTSFNVKEETGFIRFGCESTQATYIITKLQEHFTGLTFSAIEQSDKFRSKQNNPIKADSLSKYKTTTLTVKEQDNIDKQFQSFLKKK